ncbi:hypothetical protein [Ancylobacter pratisalsi]|uniref:Uncharacterized protein n=1 Tax=Ancylobacter pratisalsi TaxID=1745854 RepID=A0A6P1YHN7_9HYPH|nr:hypothetical protein [Ancylobacter pratisalsi]QIB32662.1 hypothetical protein G3A50_02300 [Ancylobacter pratisalsi]
MSGAILLGFLLGAVTTLLLVGIASECALRRRREQRDATMDRMRGALASIISTCGRDGDGEASERIRHIATSGLYPPSGEEWDRG